ncbi:class I SAM-dependent methyltransferase [Arcanobacterium buesumense]|uniref:Methyltransferase n=1 Tax=Arcanobacterium buesumense TaxID=2722751 RepID=A0A6H2EN04_9ACTO|nr:methyltransferase [Arcanobacterium buesumense]QJC22432.1 methyltransferase [Arcanobacterium buesumense]
MIAYPTQPLMPQHLSRLNNLMIDQAQEAGWQAGRPICIYDDPTGQLLTYFLPIAKKVTVLSDSHAQNSRSIAYAMSTGQREKLWVRGIDGPLQLDHFLHTMKPGYAEQSLIVTALPKSLSELQYVAHCAARVNIPTLIGANNTKHMTRSQNDVLASAYRTVVASRGSGKFRALIASHPRANLLAPAPQKNEHIYAIGATFAGVQADRGGQLLATTARADWESDPGTVLDFGSGNGAVSALIAQTCPNTAITATDISADAVTSTQLTLESYCDRTTITWDTSAQNVATNSIDVVLLNPPFHDGFTIDDTLVDELLSAARRVLKPGGKIYVVYNSHLRYRPRIAQLFTDVVQLARDSRFTVVRGAKL